jgi:hypothetical protein
MSRLARAAVAALGLAALVGSMALPLLGLLLADEPAPFCCRGRCCCAGAATDDRDGRPCLRVRCPCETPGAVAIAAPLRLEAVLAPVALPTPARVRARRLSAAAPRPLDRPDAPPFPPPRRPLPA